jgi:hypothetical protein
MSAVKAIRPSGEVASKNADWLPSLEWDKELSEEWVHASCRDDKRLRALAAAAGLPDAELSVLKLADAHALLRTHGSYPLLFLQIPTTASEGFPAVERDWLLAVFGSTNVLTASTGTGDDALLEGLAHGGATQGLAAVSSDSGQTTPFQTRVIARLLAHVIARNRAVADRFEQEVMRLETLEGNAEFLRATFRLRREISSAELDLWHLRSIVRALADGTARIGNLQLQDEEVLDDLARKPSRPSES